MKPRAVKKEAAPLNQRDMLHRCIDALSADSLPDVVWMLQQYAARDLNRRYEQEQTERTCHK